MFSKILEIFATVQFLKFLFVGGLASILHWGSRIYFNNFFSYEYSLLLAYFVGIAVAYILNARFVFSSNSQQKVREIVNFAGFNLLMLPIVFSVSYMLSEWLFLGYLDIDSSRKLAHAMGVLAPVFVNFTYHKFVTFGES